MQQVAADINHLVVAGELPELPQSYAQYSATEDITHCEDLLDDSLLATDVLLDEAEGV